jgi:hypothetical protein
MRTSPFIEEILTERLLLRPVEISDVELLWPDISDPEIAKLMAWSAHTDKAQTLEFLKGEVARYQSEKGVTWALLMDGAFCGNEPVARRSGDGFARLAFHANERLKLRSIVARESVLLTRVLRKWPNPFI